MKMKIKNKEIQVNDYGMYNANEIYNSLENPRLSAEEFLEEVKEQNTSSYDSEELYEVKDGSNPVIFLCEYLTYVFLFRNGYEHLLKAKSEMEAYRQTQILTRYMYSSAYQEELDAISDNSYWRGYNDAQDALTKDIPSQALEISLDKFWCESVGNETQYRYEDFVRHAQITSFLFLDAGKGEVLSRYDWESETYWITPEFGFYLLAFFPATSNEMRNGIRSLISYTGGNIWKPGRSTHYAGDHSVSS